MQSLAYAYETGAKFWKTMEIRENIRKNIIKKIWADLSENRLNSDNFITKKFRQTFNCPPGKDQPRTPMKLGHALCGRLCLKEWRNLKFYPFTSIS